MCVPKSYGDGDWGQISWVVIIWRSLSSKPVRDADLVVWPIQNSHLRHELNWTEVGYKKFPERDPRDTLLAMVRYHLTPKELFGTNLHALLRRLNKGFFKIVCVHWGRAAFERNEVENIPFSSNVAKPALNMNLFALFSIQNVYYNMAVCISNPDFEIRFLEGAHTIRHQEINTKT